MTDSIGVGMLGYAFMGKAHAQAYRTLPHLSEPARLRPRLVSVAGRNEAAVAEAASLLGFARFTTDWREVVADPEIRLFDNSGPNSLHAEPTIAALEAGKHVLCEKPLGRTADESYAMLEQAVAAGVKHMCAFNYRFVPAVRLARDLIEAGELGEIHQFRGAYLQDWIVDPGFERVWRLDKAAAGSGALGDLGSHLVDLARFLVGEIDGVAGARLRTFLENRPGGKVDVDDAFEAVVDFENGAVGTLGASRFGTGRKNSLRWEIYGAKGSLAFDLERLNELQIGSQQGFRTLLVTEPEHPFMRNWWPPGHVLGWEHTFVHELHHLLEAIASDADVAPYGATFADGYRAAEICDAIARASESGAHQAVEFRTS